jgi:hypothetical protein
VGIDGGKKFGIILEREREKMKKPKIIRDAERQARMCFVGIAIPHQPSLAAGEYGPIRSEKVLKFNRKALRNIGKKKSESVDSRIVGNVDHMRFPVGKPGSVERVNALIAQYASLAENEESPFEEV